MYDRNDFSMKLFYYQRCDRTPNFGDELNTWLWPKLMPGSFDDDESTLFVGTGTLLNSLLTERTKAAQRLIIFSTGAGYEQPLRQIPQHWQIACVRGPLSAAVLALPAKTAITDGGILVNRCFKPSGEKTATYGFMPHIHHATYAATDWKRICEPLGIRYIDPRGPVEQALEAVSQVNVLLAEAMHGAIVADSLRVHWIPIVTSPRILRFKWQDWCASMELPYCPQVLPPLASYPRYGRGVRSGVRSAAHWRDCLQQSPLLSSSHQAKISQRLTKIMTQGKAYLSEETVLGQRLEQLEYALLRLSSRF
ncbi:MAG: polysaccharide pyruvyl transferase family protein [Cyanobacteria bacterium J06635_1]